MGNAVSAAIIKDMLGSAAHTSGYVRSAVHVGSAALVLG